MKTEKRPKTLQQVVKETIDAVYEYLTPHPEGITMVANEYGSRGSRVISKLVSRGIITKEPSVGHLLRYRWVATMAPTNVLYGSITDEIKTEMRKHQAGYRRKHSNKKKGETPVPADTPIVNDLITPEPERSNLEIITEMWNRMKEMGVSIENNQLVLTEVKVTKTVLA